MSTEVLVGTLVGVVLAIFIVPIQRRYWNSSWDLPTFRGWRVIGWALAIALVVGLIAGLFVGYDAVIGFVFLPIIYFLTRVKERIRRGFF